MSSRSFSKILTSTSDSLQKSLPRIEKPALLLNDTNNNEEKQKQHKWWHTSREFKVMASIALGIASYVVNSYHDRKKALKDVKLELVNEQVLLCTKNYLFLKLLL